MDEALWPVVLERIAQAFGARAINLQLVDSQSGASLRSLSHGIPEERMQDYQNHYIMVDPRVSYGLKHPDRLIYDYLHTSEAEMDRDPYYAWLEQGDFRYYLAGTVLQDDAVQAFAALQRSPKQEHFLTKEIERFGQLVPHLRRAMQIGRLVNHCDLRLSASEEVLQSLTLGIVILNPSGKVIYANETASRLATGDGLTLTCHGIAIADRATAGHLGHLLGCLLRPGSDVPSPGGRLVVPRQSGRRPLILTVSPLPARTHAFGLERSAVLIVMHDQSEQAILDPGLLQSLYGLTTSEAKLAIAISGGMKLKQISDSTGRSSETLRSHLKQVFAKTGTHSQAELVSLMLRTSSSNGRAETDIE